MEIRFEWDATKARANSRKHGVTFEDTQSVFLDEQAILFYDDEHSEWEDRFLLLGRSQHLHLELVCHCERDEGGLIRIISARKATSAETSHYPGEST